MSKKIYVGGLPYSMVAKQLEELFSKFGEVTSADVINDRFTGQSKGFGFVEMKNDEEANDAIAKLNNSEIEGRKVVVNEARPREEKPNYSNNRSNGGGYQKRSGSGNRWH